MAFELIEASRYGEIDAVQGLLKSGGRNLVATGDDNGQTALHMAAANGHAEIVTLLCSFLLKHDINASNAQGNTALHWASMSAHGDCVKVLLEHGADARKVNAAGKSSITLAFESESNECLVLLMNSFDPDSASDCDETAEAQETSQDATDAER